MIFLINFTVKNESYVKIIQDHYYNLTMIIVKNFRNFLLKYQKYYDHIFRVHQKFHIFLYFYHLQLNNYPNLFFFSLIKILNNKIIPLSVLQIKLYDNKF